MNINNGPFSNLESLLRPRSFITSDPGPSKKQSKKKLLAQTLKQETENFAKTLSAQLKTLACINELLTPTTPLIFEGRFDV